MNSPVFYNLSDEIRYAFQALEYSIQFKHDNAPVTFKLLRKKLDHLINGA